MSKKLVLVYNYDGSIPPLGIAYISSYVKAHLPNWETHIICNRFAKDIVQSILDCQPTVVGFYSLTPGLNSRVRSPAKRLRKHFKGPLMMGGPHISTLPDKMPPEFDWGVIGEGELTVKELLETFENKTKLTEKELSTINGIVFRNDQGIITKTSPRERIKDLDALPLPDYEQMNIKKYFPKRHREFPTKVLRGASITTSRGCPFSCAFCQEAGENSTYFGVDRFIQECSHLADQYDVNFIDVMDDLFIYNRKRLKQMAQAVEESGLNKKVQFFGYVRADHLTEENIQLLKKMNFKSVFIGFESASPRILSFLKNKKSDGSENVRAIKLCHQYDILVYGSFIFGSPGETIEDVEMTANFIRDYPMALIEWQILTPLPGTKVWDIAIEKGMINPDDIDYDNLLLRDTFDPQKPWMSECMTKKEFDRYYQDILKPIFWAQSQRANHFNWKDLLNPTLWKWILQEPRFYASILKQTLKFKKQYGYVDVPATA